MPQYYDRSVDPLTREILAELPAVMLIGPRAIGKTTTASRMAATIVQLDRPAEAVAFQSDPDAAMRGLAEPVLLDEWQVVPGVLGAVKRAVDSDPRPGRFLLTGSARADLDAPTWPGTGRLVRLSLYGMTIAEQLGRPHVIPLLDRLARGAPLAAAVPTPDLRGYVELALCSGFPEAALSLSDRIRPRWIESYVDQLTTRDVEQLDDARDPAKIWRYFEALCLNTAGVVSDKTLYEAAGINRKTALAYEQLLVNLLVVERVPPWTSNRLKRLSRSPKRYLIDAALMAGTLRLDPAAVLRDGNLLGRALDTFVASQLRVEREVAASRPRLYHLRQLQGRHEVDLVVELAGGALVGIEVKADAAPRKDAARHLRWMRDRLGRRFAHGVVLHTGPRVYPLGERITAAPISTLWASSPVS